MRQAEKYYLIDLVVLESFEVLLLIASVAVAFAHSSAARLVLRFDLLRPYLPRNSGGAV